MKWWAVWLVVTQLLQAALAAKILALCAVASHSHSLWCYQYMAALAERGHQITVFGVDKPKINIPNLTTFIAEEVYEMAFKDDAVADWKPKGIIPEITDLYNSFRTWSEISSEKIMHSKALKDLTKQYENIEKPFDLIIHDNANVDALLGLVPLFGNPPLVLATTYGSPQWMTFRAGNIFNPAYVPSMITRGGQQMNFYMRCKNTLHYFFLEWFTASIIEPFQDKLMRETFGGHLPYVRDITKQANIVIVNYHFAQNGARPMLPGVIGIAGLHISEPRPLPQDLKNFMDGAEHGVILLSFGSNVDSNWFHGKFESIILEALGLLPQRVLWKWNRMLPNTPHNVKMSQWLPQGDIIVHPKMRLFITHCGLLSTQEAIYRKVPILALPVFLDQLDNAEFLVGQNLTIKLDVDTMTADQLYNGINEVLTNKMYKANIDKLGELMNDVPLTAKQQAVFWTEYAIRHQGAAHLRSAAADMPWHQLLLLDVIGFVLLLLFLTLWLLKRMFSYFTSLIFSKVKTKAD